MLGTICDNRSMPRLAQPQQGITFEELRKATRNRGMPLEALELDTTPAGLHYLLAHFDIPLIDPADWTLRVGGNVESPIALTLADLRSMPAVTLPVTMECAGNGRTLMDPRPVDQPWGLEAVSTGEWTGVKLSSVLELAEPQPGTSMVVFTGADRGIQSGVEDNYRRALPVGEISDEVLLAYDLNGEPLQPQSGAPVRLIVPGWYGMAHVKWLVEIDLTEESFRGIQHVYYRYKDSEADPGEPVTRIRVRALMAPPGIPESFTRHRFVTAGSVSLTGRAWSGWAPITRVEVAVDGRWHEATLAWERSGPWAWRKWSWEWNAEPGEHELACRATDANGNTQPDAPIWNLHGMGNNSIQRISVTVS